MIPCSPGRVAALCTCMHACVYVHVCAYVWDAHAPGVLPTPPQVCRLRQWSQRGANPEGGNSVPRVLPWTHPPQNCSVTQGTLFSLSEPQPLSSDGGIIMVTLQCFEARR